MQQIKLLGSSGVSATIGLGYQGAGVKEVLGGAGNDAIDASTTTAGMTLDGGVGNDNLTGGSGNDTLLGYEGSDTFIGGNGDDLYIVKGNVTVSATGSGGIDTVCAYGRHTLASGVEALQLFDVDDYDWVKVNLVAGNTYQFDMKGMSTNRGTLGQCRLELYAENSFSTPVARDAGGVGTDDFFTYSPTYTGYHYIRAFGDTSTGTYELTVTVI